MKAALKGKYEYTSDKSASFATSTVAIPAGDFKLKASLTDASLVKPASFNLNLNGLSFSLEKPGFFVFDYYVPKKDFRFQFMNSVKILEKRLNMTYIHHRGDNRTLLEGTLVLDSSNKVSANHMLSAAGFSKNGKIKYSYLHQETTTFEPSYDLGKNCWDFALSRKLYGGDDVLKASYQTFNHNLGLEWSRNSKTNGCFKLSAIFNLAEEVKMPKLMAESTWKFEM